MVQDLQSNMVSKKALKSSYSMHYRVKQIRLSIFGAQKNPRRTVILQLLTLIYVYWILDQFSTETNNKVPSLLGAILRRICGPHLYVGNTRDYPCTIASRFVVKNDLAKVEAYMGFAKVDLYPLRPKVCSSGLMSNIWGTKLPFGKAFDACFTTPLSF